MRVLHGVTGAANQPATVSRFQRGLGADARCVTVSADGFGYGADFEVDPGADALVSYSEFLASAVEDYDVFHFYFRSFFFFEPANNAFPSGLDLLMLRAAGKTVVMHYRGSEVREAERFREFSPYNYVDENPSGIFTKFREPSLSSRIDYVRSVANVVLVPDEELQSYVPGSRIVRRAIDLADFSVPPDPENEVPLVIHAPSRRIVKGTDYVLEAVEQLRADGVRFDFRLVENLAHKEAKQLYREADIIIDQLRIGWFGVFALEAMALGKCVLAYVRDDLRPSLGEAPPLLFTNPDELVEDLRAAIGDAELRATIGARGRAYVETHHDATEVAKELLDLYQNPEVSGHPIDVGGVLDYLQVQRADTKAVYPRKFSQRVAPAVENGELIARFRRIWKVHGPVEAVRRVARFFVRRIRRLVRGYAT